MRIMHSVGKIHEVIHLYNFTKEIMDMVDPKWENYSVFRSTHRWPLTIFFELFNIAGVSENILCDNTCIKKKKKTHKIKRRF